MKSKNPILALDMPSESDELVGWLESQLVGYELRSIVRQLEIMRDVTGDDLVDGRTWNDRLKQSMGADLTGVIASGLSVLSDEKLSELVRYPRLLLALQDRVLLDGSDYWNAKAALADDTDAVAGDALGQGTNRTQGTKVILAPVQGLHRFSVANGFWALASLAAAMLIAFFVYQSGPDEGRFFARHGLLNSQSTDQSFLRQLATAVQTDWQEDDLPFGQKLRLLRDSCDQLLQADLRQLNPKVAQELKDRCLKWRNAFTANLNDLDSGGPLDSIQTNADETVQRLTKLLLELG